MKDILEYLIELLKPLGYPGLAGVLAAVAAGLGTMGKLGTALYTRHQQRRLLHDLHPFYTAQEIQRATQYYVETTCQNVAPSKTEEPEGGRGHITTEKIIPLFLNKAFTTKDENQFCIVLADSGMGKTTFLINLYLRYIEQFWGARYRIVLLPLGFPEVDREIEKIPEQEQRRTILLLDAFDEDIQAVHDYKTRLNALVKKTLHFREIVITCRTQFFPTEEEEPKETGVMRFGGAGGERIFWKLYISPFNHEDIRTYLRKRFPFTQRAKRAKAQKIVESCPYLMVRPMLLSYIEDLLQREKPYCAAFEVYTELINRWIEREADKMPAGRREHYKEGLYQFSREIAVDLHRKRDQRDGRLLISGAEIQPFADKHGIRLSAMEMKSRSLLNRNALGEYKFSHKSVLEYFLAEEAIVNPAFRPELNFDGMEQAKAFFEEMIWRLLTLPFFERDDLNGEYRLQTGKLRVLTPRLPERVITEITFLKFRKWNASDDVLLFKGLKNLTHLNFGMLTSTQEDELRQALPERQIEVTIRLPLRSEPATVSADEVRKVCGLDEKHRPLEYIQNDYEEQGEVVIDHATGLMWQKSGSKKELTYTATREYVDKLNRNKFAGYADWGLPTIPELMSLLEPEERNGYLYIAPIFDDKQRWCWSADLRQKKGEGSAESAWLVDFTHGSVYGTYLSSDCSYVRVVRSRQ